MNLDNELVVVCGIINLLNKHIDNLTELRKISFDPNARLYLNEDIGKAEQDLELYEERKTTLIKLLTSINNEKLRL